MFFLRINFMFYGVYFKNITIKIKLRRFIINLSLPKPDDLRGPRELEWLVGVDIAMMSVMIM